MTEKASQGHELLLELGTRAYPLPEFGTQNPRAIGRSIVPPTPEVAHQRLNELLASIEAQGGQLLGVINIGVAIPPEPGCLRSASDSEPKAFLVIKK
ncbi:hypothetical protein FJZ40_05315 [Candidatus Shapirobacteria bacterium]|nr:hypothetical protein [Candidatus Shapirobacteria bacterium]